LFELQNAVNKILNPNIRINWYLYSKMYNVNFKVIF
jgi:hypothetical protein